VQREALTETSAGSAAVVDKKVVGASSLEPALKSRLFRECIKRPRFDASRDAATPEIRNLLSRLNTCAWNRAGLDRVSRMTLILDLLDQIDTNLETMAHRQMSAYPAMCKLLISSVQQLSVNEAFRSILSSLNWNRSQQVSLKHHARTRSGLLCNMADLLILSCIFV
jgi:hypothetical protein